MMKPEPDDGTRCWRGAGWPKKRFMNSSDGSPLSPPTFLVTSMNTTAGSARSMTDTNGLSGIGAELVTAASSALAAREARGRLRPALSPKPSTSPAVMSAAAPRK